MNNFLSLFLCALFGLAFVTVTRMQSLKTDFEKANQVFVYKKYFQKEALALIASFLSIGIWFLLFPEVSAKYPSLINFIRCTFVAFGAMGSWIAQRALSKTKVFIRNVVDVKTNELDAMKEDKAQSTINDQ